MSLDKISKVVFDGGGVVVAETFAVEDSVKIPIFGRGTI
jgi:hypothetical protein